MCDYIKRLAVYIMQQLHQLESAESRSWAAPAGAGGAVFSSNINAKSVFSSQLSIKAGQEVDPDQYSMYFLCGVGNQTLICQNSQTQFLPHFVIDFVIY